MRTIITVLTGTILCSSTAWAGDTTPHQLSLNLPASPHWKTQTVMETRKAQFGQSSDTTESFSYDNHAVPQNDGFVVTRTLAHQDLKTSGMDMSAIMLGDRQKAYRRDLSEAIGNIAYTTDSHLTPRAIIDWEAVKAKMRAVSVTYMGDMGARTFEATLGQTTPESAAGSYLSAQSGVDGLYADPLVIGKPVLTDARMSAVLINADIKATQSLTLKRWDTFSDKAEYTLDIAPDTETLKATLRQFISQMMQHADPIPGASAQDAQSLANGQKSLDAFMTTGRFDMSTHCRMIASIKTGLITKNQCDTQVNISLPPVGSGGHPGTGPTMKISNASRVVVTQALLP